MRMNSQVVDPGLAAAIDQIHAGLNTLFAGGVAPASRDDALAVIREVETLGRRMDAAQIAVLVLALGVLIGLVGSMIGLRRFLRV